MPNIASLIHHHLSGDNAQALTEAITQFWRAPGSSGYHAATNLVADHLRAIGIPEIDVSTYPLDGQNPISASDYAAGVDAVQGLGRSPAPQGDRRSA